MIEKTHTVSKREHSLEQLRSAAESALRKGSPFQVESKSSSTGSSVLVSASAHRISIVPRGNDYDMIVEAPQEVHDLLQREIDSGNARGVGPSSREDEQDEEVEYEFEDVTQGSDDFPQAAEAGNVQAEVTIFEDGTVNIDKMGGESRTMQTAAGFFLLAGRGDDGKLNIGEAYTVEQFGKEYRESDIRRAVQSIEETLSEM